MSEKKVQEIGDKIDRDLEKTDWKAKFTGIFKGKKNVKEADKLAFSGSMGDALARSMIVENPLIA